ncbi:hypothetical protein TH61_05325 [Rufibacter sp. DG15C]|uniref:SMI1/KNR4 family protein n=1 Tax=Rufibacter sp. DG15C TaxID=1379909 RepID=UPI00078BDE11|nr:SMI1/KNR4 family protein [Rufibacter sp. DG15C]AMM50713.1 hypothetical protein TH61_05325 [Rufibacter sp. DG15C]
MEYTLVEEELGMSIPEEVTALVANEAIHLGKYNLRLLEPQEVIEEYAYLQEESTLTFGLPLLPFLTDGNSNSVGIYCSGVFRGMLVYLDHEDLDFTPAFKSVDSFTEHLWLNEPENIGEETEYPRAKGAEEDYPLFLLSLTNYRETEDRDTKTYWALCALNFVPDDEPGILREFLLSGDKLVHEKACAVIRARKDCRFIEDLGSLVDFSAAQTNKNIAAINTLGELGTAESRQTLLSLVEGKETGGYGIYLLHALGRCGVETKKVPNQMKGWEFYFLDEEKGEWLQLK